MPLTTLIAAQDLAHRLGRPGLVIIDCRFDLAAPAAGRRAYRDGHIPTAWYADLAQDLSAPVTPDTGRHPLPDRGTLARTLARFGLRDDSQAVVYDASSGAFAARAWWLLRWLGHPAVAVLDGGFDAWLAAGGAVESGDGAAAPSDGARSVAAAEGAQSVVTTAQLAASLGERRHLLVDARSPERFAGTVEPLDAVAGHVPGAVNHPFTANLDATGRFLPADELRRRWLARLSGAAPDSVVAMCGSGVTACHNLLALEVAGLPGARLYAGSWSEWIRSPDRLVALGASS